MAFYNGYLCDEVEVQALFSQEETPNASHGRKRGEEMVLEQDNWGMTAAHTLCVLFTYTPMHTLTHTTGTFSRQTIRIKMDVALRDHLLVPTFHRSTQDKQQRIRNSINTEVT